MDSRIIDIAYIKQHRKIAVLDTGLNTDCTEFMQKEIEYVKWNGNDSRKDLSGHGTGIVNEIFRYNANAELIIISVLNKDNTLRGSMKF